MVPKRLVAALGLVIPLVGLPALAAAEKPNQGVVTAVGPGAVHRSGGAAARSCT
jgi:co-chaperonin GroES (HSP10)